MSNNQETRYGEKINQTQNDTVQSTRNMVAYSQNIRGMAAETLANLEEQNENLDNAEKRFDNIDQNLDMAQHHMDDYDKCCGLFVCPWNRFRPRTKAYKPEKIKPEKKAKLKKRDKKNPEIEINGNFDVPKILENDCRETEINQNMQEVYAASRDMNSMAKEMLAQVQQSNQKIDRVAGKLEHKERKVADANDHAFRSFGIRTKTEKEMSVDNLKKSAIKALI